MSSAIIGAAAVFGGAALGAGGSIMQGNSQRKAQAESDAANQAIAEANRRQNQEQFDRTHKNDFLLQDQLLPYFQNYTQGFLNDGGSFQQQIADRQSILDSYAPTIDANQRFLTGVYDGSNLNTRLGAAGVTGDARIQAAEQQQASIDEALRQVQSQLAAENARNGFSGGGSFANNRLLASTIGARQSAAGVMGDATVTNAGDRQRLIEGDLNQQGVYSSQLPGMIASQMGLKDLPAQSVYNKLGQVVQPLSYFKGNPTFSQGAGPMTSPDPAAGVEGRVISDAGSAFMDWGLKNSLSRQQDRYGVQPYTGPSVPANRTGTVFDFSKNFSDYKPTYTPPSQFDFSSTLADWTP